MIARLNTMPKSKQTKSSGDTGKQFESDGRKVQDAERVGGMSPDADGGTESSAPSTEDNPSRRPTRPSRR